MGIHFEDNTVVPLPKLKRKTRSRDQGQLEIMRYVQKLIVRLSKLVKRVNYYIYMIGLVGIHNIYIFFKIYFQSFEKVMRVNV